MKSTKERTFDRIKEKAKTEGKNRFINNVEMIHDIEDVKEFLKALVEEL